MNTGYLSGAAGAAFMYLKLHDVFGDDSYLTEARKLFSWLENTDTGPMVQFKDGSVAWKLAIDPQGGDVPALATGFEEGSAGIGWTYLQAYRLTGEKRYLDVAKRAGNWLIKVAVREDNGVTWREHESPAKQITHANLNNGAAGIGLFLLDLAELSGKEKYRDCAEAAQQWLINSARRDDETTPLYWDDNDGENYYSRDPSWHWGTAGIVAFLARMAGGKQDIPGQQESIRRR